MLMLLVGCNQSADLPSPSQLPHPPADIQQCFRDAVGIPNRALTAGEVEALWKDDRVRVKINKLCGNRLYQWYMSLRANWK